METGFYFREQKLVPVNPCKSLRVPHEEARFAPRDGYGNGVPRRSGEIHDGICDLRAIGGKCWREFRPGILREPNRLPVWQRLQPNLALAHKPIGAADKCHSATCLLYTSPSPR